MKRIIVLIAALVALVTAAPAVAATTNVSITRSGFVPNQVTIKQGDTITWTNSDTQNHQVVSQDVPFSSPVLAPNQTFSFTFTKAGKFTITDPLGARNNTRMTVTVTAVPAPQITLNASRRLLTYGGSVTLSGALSSQQTGETVTLEQQQCGATTFTKVTTAVTTTGGAFTFTVKPLKNTTYQIRYRSATSGQVTVRVRPRITLGKVAPRRFTVRVRAADSFAGRPISVQRWNTVTRRWVLVRYATLRANSTGIAPTVVSSVTFTLRVKARTKLRVVMGPGAVGSCYAPGVSNAVLA